MDRVLADDLPALHSLVNGMKRDLDAVTAGLSTPWSSGQVEGHVTRAKLLKRMGFDRANLDLLRKTHPSHSVTPSTSQDPRQNRNTRSPIRGAFRGRHSRVPLTTAVR
jgi:hypothetical protein